MPFWTYQNLVEVTHGTWLIEPDDLSAEVAGLWHDTRDIKPGQAYLAIAGDDRIPPNERTKRVDLWRDLHLETDFFVLVDGRDAAEIPSLVRESELQTFLDNFGARPN